MSKFTNTSAGARGINIEDEQGHRTIWIEPGETFDIDDKVISDKAFSDDIKKGDAAAKSAADAAATKKTEDAAAA